MKPLISTLVLAAALFAGASQSLGSETTTVEAAASRPVAVEQVAYRRFGRPYFYRGYYRPYRYGAYRYYSNPYRFRASPYRYYNYSYFPRYYGWRY